MPELNLSKAHPSWLPLLIPALKQVDPTYLQNLRDTHHWLPNHDRIFNAFSLPLHQTRYILFGESPYPRAASANGYAFWDQRVEELWTSTGLAKTVNRATSLRNMIKMLLVADGKLTLNDLSPSAIAAVPKQDLVSTASELFGRFLDRGFLLLNASLVLSSADVKKDAAAWRPFMATLLELLAKENTHVTLILFGHVAKMINNLPAATHYKKLCSEHPYNISFIYNAEVLDFFRELKLLVKCDK